PVYEQGDLGPVGVVALFNHDFTFFEINSIVLSVLYHNSERTPPVGKIKALGFPGVFYVKYLYA
ncbi:MAG TPA: hypothetical protein VGB72_02825, partial [Acidobacteriota bacterium]